MVLVLSFISCASLRPEDEGLADANGTVQSKTASGMSSTGHDITARLADAIFDSFVDEIEVPLGIKDGYAVDGTVWVLGADCSSPKVLSVNTARPPEGSPGTCASKGNWLNCAQTVADGNFVGAEAHDLRLRLQVRLDITPPGGVGALAGTVLIYFHIGYLRAGISWDGAAKKWDAPVPVSDDVQFEVLAFEHDKNKNTAGAWVVDRLTKNPLVNLAGKLGGKSDEESALLAIQAIINQLHVTDTILAKIDKKIKSVVSENLNDQQESTSGKLKQFAASWAAYGATFQTVQKIGSAFKGSACE